MVLCPQAAEYYAKGLALQPGDVESRAALADTLSNLRRHGEAARHYALALAADPLHGGASALLVQFRHFRGGAPVPRRLASARLRACVHACMHARRGGG